MNLDHPSARWLERVNREGGPLYRALVEALGAAIREGELQPGDQLPPQRTVAGLLGIDFTTVTRAYGLARERGLIAGAVGRGTFVGARATNDEAGVVDLSMNLPPPPAGVSLAALLKETTRAILERSDLATLMSYHAGPGTLGQRAAAASWLAPVLGGGLDLDRLLVCAGAQTALAAVLSLVARPGEALVVEPLTYPGLLAAARQRGLRLLACPVDGEGFEPEALERLCASERPAAIYVVPTTSNPTATTMGVDRRREVARIASMAGVAIIEDDPYSRLLDAPPPALATFAPERTWHIATLSKCLSPGLRTAFVSAPGRAAARALDAELRALALMPAPLMTAVAASWIREGQADALLAGVRAEARARRAIAAQVLPQATGPAEGVHVWLDLPAGWPPERLHAMAQARGLALVAADAFAAGEGYRSGVRISLGGPGNRAVLTAALKSVAEMLG